METYEQVLVSLHQITCAIDLHSKKLERELGLTGPQLLIMQPVDTQGEMTSGVVARKVSLSQAKGHNLDRLEKKGLLTRKRCTHDKHKVMVSLTEEGQGSGGHPYPHAGIIYMCLQSTRGLGAIADPLFTTACLRYDECYRTRCRPIA